MPILEHAYRRMVPPAAALLPLLARGDGKLARAVRGRRGVLREMEAWAATHRDPARPLVWFHAPSVGEGLQARAVMEILRERRTDLQLIYTFFSPSAESFAASVPADWAGYLPFDRPRECAAALAVLLPDLLAFTKTEVWPNLTREAVARGVPVALLSATLPATAGRLRGPARALLRPAHRRLSHVAAITHEDAERFLLLGVPVERRSVMGDARFDQVWARAEGVDRSSDLFRTLLSGDLPVLVAGSTWPADEARVVPAIARLKERGISVRLILAPHEPTEHHLDTVEARMRGLKLSYARLSAVEAGAALPEALIVDRVGVLGDLYAAANVAYVGGGFGNAGLHSVLEPAAFGAPVLFGPRHGNAREAPELVAAGGAAVVEGADELAERLRCWLTDEAARGAAGAAARAYVQHGRGAAERGADVVEALLRR